MARRSLGRYEQHVKRIRTYETPVSGPIVLSADVPSLQELCTHKITRGDGCRNILAGLTHFGSVSNHIAQLLLRYLEEDQLRNLIADDKSFLNQPSLCQIYEFSLKFYLNFTDRFVSFLTRHNLKSLSLCNSFIDYTSLDQLARHQTNLEYLDISYCLQIERFDPIFKFGNLTFLNLEKTHFKLTATTAHGFVWLKNLLWLGLSKLGNHNNENSPLSLQLLSCVNPGLLGLDLSETFWDVSQHSKLLQFKRLEMLDVSQYPRSSNAENHIVLDDVLQLTISKMTSLRSLDISKCLTQRYEAVTSLSNLDLDFLGAVGIHVPVILLETLAKKVASQQNLEGTLLQLYKYCNNVTMLESAIRNLYSLHSSRTDLGYDCETINPQLFEAVLFIGEKYTGHPTIQQIASACLFSLNHKYFDKYQVCDPSVRFEEPYPGHERHVKRGLILLTMGVLDNLKQTESEDVLTILSNCVRIINDYIMYDEEYLSLEITHAMMQILEKFWNHPILEEPPTISKRCKVSLLALNIVNRYVCQASGPKKVQFGKMRLVELILSVSRCLFELFRRQPQSSRIHSYKLLLAQAWSMLWNITDEQADNCDRFIAADGLLLYYETFTAFQTLNDRHVTTLIRNMLGLMGNIAEVQHIREQLTTNNLLNSFYLLQSFEGETFSIDRCDIIEIRYSAAGILSYICTDGPEKWKTDYFTYQEILDGIETAVVSWDHRCKRSINYRSFNPILSIIRSTAPYPCKMWAVWALTNLCEFRPKRFVPMLRRDGGVELLESLRHETLCPGHIRRLATLTLVQAYDKEIGNEIEDLTVR